MSTTVSDLAHFFTWLLNSGEGGVVVQLMDSSGTRPMEDRDYGLISSGGVFIRADNAVASV